MKSLKKVQTYLFAECFNKLFIGGQFVDPRHHIGGELVKRSALGVVAIYNMLPANCKTRPDVKSLQAALQSILEECAQEGSCFIKANQTRQKHMAGEMDISDDAAPLAALKSVPLTML